MPLPDPRLEKRKIEKTLLVNDRLFSSFVRRDMDVEAFKNSFVRDVFRDVRSREVLPAFIADIETDVKRIKQRGNAGRIRKTKAWKRLSDRVSAGSTNVSQASRRSMVKGLRDFARQESVFTVKALGEEIPFDFSAAVPGFREMFGEIQSKPMTEASGTMGQAMTTVGRNLKERTLKTIMQGLVNGETPEQIIRRVTGTGPRFRNGVIEQTGNEITANVHTAVTHTKDGVYQATFKLNKDVVKLESWTAILDDGTCPICAGLDGTTFPVGEGRFPPEHPYCRCIRIPVVKSAKELGVKGLDPIMRNSLDGRVPVKTGFSTWLKGQPRHVQEDILGVTKASLFRKGTFSLGEFSSTRGKGRILTLDDLAKKAGLDKIPVVRRKNT